MSYAQYQNALTNLASDELKGEDIESEIARLAAEANMTPNTVRAEVTERIDLLKD